MSKGKGKKKGKTKSGGGGDSASSSGADANSTTTTSFSPSVLSLSSLSGAVKEGGRGAEKEKDKDGSHNCEACLVNREKEASSREASWEKLPPRKLEKFLADINQQGTITIPLEEVRQEIELVTCQSCVDKLRETLSACLESSQPTVICSSIKVVPDSGDGSLGLPAMSIVSPLTAVQIAPLKELIASATSCKQDEEVQKAIIDVVAEEKQKFRLLSGDSTALSPSSLGLPPSLGELVSVTDEVAKRAGDFSGPLKSKMHLADQEDTSPRPFVEWGTPRHSIGHLIQGMDSVLTRWVEHMTKLVSRISRLEPFIMFLQSSKAKEKLREVVNAVWSAYEKGMDQILDFSIKTRQEQMREANMHGLFGILATKSNAQKINSMLRKKEILDEMHDSIMLYCKEGTEGRLVLNETARLARVREDYFVSEDWQTLDSLEEEILSVRTHLVQENTSLNFIGRGELVQHDQHLENQLKKLLNDWENTLDKIQPMLLESAQAQLAPASYPQTKPITQDLQEREEEFKKDWESHKDTYSLQARISQQEVSSLNTEAHMHKQKIKALKSSSEKESKKRNTNRRGEGNLIEAAVETEGDDALGEGGGNAGDDDEKSSRHSTNLALTHQKQLEHCLRFRSFATRNYVSRMRMLREFHVYVRWMVSIRPKLEVSLCGDQSHALKKIRLMLARQLMKKLDRECNSWQARQVEAQLMEDAQREYEKRQRKDQRKQAKNQSAKQQKVEALNSKAALEEKKSKEKEPEPIRKIAVDVEPSWQIGYAQEDESMDGWTTVAERDSGSGWSRGSSNRRRQHQHQHQHQHQQEARNNSGSRPARSTPKETAPPAPSAAARVPPPPPPPPPVQHEEPPRPTPAARRHDAVPTSKAAAATSPMETRQTASPAKDVAVSAAPALPLEVEGGPQGQAEEVRAVAGPGSEERLREDTGHHTPLAVVEQQKQQIVQEEGQEVDDDEDDVAIVFGNGAADSTSSCTPSVVEDEEEIEFGEGFVVELDDDEEEEEDERPTADSEGVPAGEDDEGYRDEDGDGDGEDDAEYEYEGEAEGGSTFEGPVSEAFHEGPLGEASCHPSNHMDGMNEHADERSLSLPLPPPPPAVERENGSRESEHPPPPPLVAPPFYFQPNVPNGGGAGPPYDSMVTPYPPPPPHGYPNVYPGRGPFLGPPPPHMDVASPGGPLYHPQQMAPPLGRGPMPYVESPGSGGGGKFKSQNGPGGMRSREGWNRGGTFHPHHNPHRHSNHPMPHPPQYFRGPRGQSGVGYGTLDLQQSRQPQPMAVHVLHQPSTPGGSGHRPSTPQQNQQAPQQQQQQQQQPPPPPFVFFPPYPHHPQHAGISPPPPPLPPHPHGDSPHHGTPYVPYDAPMMYASSSPPHGPRGAPHMMQQQRGFASQSPEKVVPPPLRQHQVQVRIDVQPNQGLHQHPRPMNGDRSPEIEDTGDRKVVNEEDVIHRGPEVAVGVDKERPESSVEEQDPQEEEVASSPIFGSTTEAESVDVLEDAPLPPAVVTPSEEEPARSMRSVMEGATPSGSPSEGTLLPAVSASPAATGSGAAGGVTRKGSKRRGKGQAQGPRSDTESRPVGLSNKVGQNHCFLNVVVQCLWNLDSFREGFCESQPPGLEAGTASGVNAPSPGAAVVDHALRSIFRGMADSGSLEAAAEKPHISVDRLRQALSDIAGENSLFRLGHMDDAIEAFEKILGYLSEGHGDTARVVQETFNLRMREMMTCPGCSRTWPNPPHDYDTTVFYVPVRQLKEVAKVGKGTKPSGVQPLDSLLMTAGNGGVYSCQNMDGCPLARRGVKQAGHRYLLSGPPQVFSLGLVWDTLRVDKEEVTFILRLIEPTLNLGAFRLPSRRAVPGPAGKGGNRATTSPPSSSSSSSGAGPRAELRAFFCFHPQKHHYVAFLSHRQSGQWVCIDDTEVQVLGPAHSDAIARCAQLQYQPILFFYSLVPGTEEGFTFDASSAVEDQQLTAPPTTPPPPAPQSLTTPLPHSKGAKGSSNNNKVSQQISPPPLDFSDDALFPSLAVNGTNHSSTSTSSSGHSKGSKAERSSRTASDKQRPA